MPIDGLIFTPLDPGRFPTFKWKPPSMLTVDLLVREGGALFALGGFYIRAVYYPHQSAPWNTHARVDHPTLERPVHMIFDPLVRRGS